MVLDNVIVTKEKIIEIPFAITLLQNKWLAVKN